MSNIATVDIGTSTWTGPYLSTLGELSSGLAFVQGMPASTCAFFDLSTEMPVVVTVQDMLFPIDIVFIDASFKVVQVEHNVQPQAPDIQCTGAQFFMEVNAGEAAAVNVGDTSTVTATIIGGTSDNTDILAAISIAAIMIMTMVIASSMMKNMTKEKMYADTRSSIYASARDDVRGVLLAECKVQNAK